MNWTSKCGQERNILELPKPLLSLILCTLLLIHDLGELINSGYYHYPSIRQIWEQPIQCLLSYDDHTTYITAGRLWMALAWNHQSYTIILWIWGIYNSLSCNWIALCYFLFVHNNSNASEASTMLPFLDVCEHSHLCRPFQARPTMPSQK